MKIGMTAIDADTVLALSQSDGKIKISEFMAWLSAKSGKPQCIGWKDNIILATDSYKFSHWKQYPPGTEYVPLGSFRKACVCRNPCAKNPGDPSFTRSGEVSKV